jgi:hypothetical protein
VSTSHLQGIAHVAVLRQNGALLRNAHLVHGPVKLSVRATHLPGQRLRVIDQGS